MEMLMKDSDCFYSVSRDRLSRVSTADRRLGPTLRPDLEIKTDIISAEMFQSSSQKVVLISHQFTVSMNFSFTIQ